MKAGEYKGRAEEKVERLEGITQSGYSASGFLNLNIGEGENWASNPVRFLGDWVFGKFHRIYMEGMPEEVSSKPICLDWLESERGLCPICAGIRPLWDGNDQDRDIARRYKAKPGFFWTCFPRDENYDYGIEGAGPVIFNFGSMVSGQLPEIYKEFGDPADPETGFVIDIQVAKQNDFNKYRLEVPKERVKTKTGYSYEFNFQPLTEEEMEVELPDLEVFLKRPTETDLKFYLGVFAGESMGKATSGSTSKPVDVKKEVASNSSKTTSKPSCFADADVYDLEDSICSVCDWKEECKEQIESGG